MAVPAQALDGALVALDERLVELALAHDDDGAVVAHGARDGVAGPRLEQFGAVLAPRRHGAVLAAAGQSRAVRLAAIESKSRFHQTNHVYHLIQTCCEHHHRLLHGSSERRFFLFRPFSVYFGNHHS